MTIDELKATAAEHGLTLDDWHGGAGKFRDVYVGTGQPMAALASFCRAIKRRGLDAYVELCTVKGHANYGKRYAVVSSFWWDEPRDIADESTLEDPLDARDRHTEYLVAKALREREEADDYPGPPTKEDEIIAAADRADLDRKRAKGE